MATECLQKNDRINASTRLKQVASQSTPRSASLEHYLQSDAMGALIRENIGHIPVAFVCTKSDQIAQKELRMQSGHEHLDTEELGILRKESIRQRMVAKLAELSTRSSAECNEQAKLRL